MVPAMWVLVVGSEAMAERPDGATEVLRDLGCRVERFDLWQPVSTAAWRNDPPTLILIEAIDEVDAARAALQRLRAVAELVSVPVLVAVSVPALGRLRPDDGFDDFSLFPYVAPELYQRIRRIEWRQSDFSAGERIKIGDLCLDLAAHEVSVQGRPIELTQQEFALLRFLAQHRDRVFSRSQLLERVWGVDYYGGSRTVDIHIRRLRMKLGTGADGIETVRGVGYKMKAPR